MEPIPYRFYLTGQSGTREAFPKNGNALAIKWEEENESAFLRKQLTGKIIFTGDDFDFLYSLEKTIYRCQAVQLRVDKDCGSGYQPYEYGRLIFSKGKWDVDRKTVEIEPEIADLYTCYNDTSDVTYNLFSYVSSRYTVSSLQGTIQELICNSNNQEPLFCGTDQTGFVIVRYSIQSDELQQQGPGQNQQGLSSVQTTWVREVISMPAGVTLDAPWTLIDAFTNTYAKSPAIFNFQSGYYSANSYWYSYDYSASFDNGLLLKDVFNFFVQLTCNDYILRSNFFQWNPTTPTDINYATGKKSKVLKLLLFQKSDVKRPNDDNNATLAEISFADLLADICNIFDLKWWIDENKNFNIEHTSYNQKAVGMVSETRSDYYLRVGKNTYTYNTDDLPRKEKFSWMDKVYGEFAGLDIVYNNDCAGTGTSSDKTTSVSNIITDVEFCLNNPKADSTAVSDDGFVLIAVDDNNGIITEAPVLGGSFLNNTLAWSHLHRDYWRYKRPFYQFLMNGQKTTALSVLPTKKQSGLVFKLCCGDHFDANELIQTILGNGHVSNASYNIYKQELTTDLLYEADADLANNDSPIAVADNVETFVGNSIIIDVLANDFDPDGQIDKSTLSIILQAANGTALITSDLKISYTPNNGFTGTDYIVYQVRDNLGQLSNNGLVTIQVKAGSALPIANPDNYSISKNQNLVASVSLLANDTGDGALYATGETKGTANGGSVTINTDGKFTYTPPSNFIGDDSFSYTLNDTKGNQATGNAKVTVFEPQSVYVRMVKDNFRNETITERCNGSVTEVGQRETQNATLYFYADSQALTVLDVTGYGLKVKINTVNNYSDGSSASNNVDFAVSGTSILVAANFVTSYNYMGCNNDQNIHETSSIDIQSGSGYQII